MLALALGTVWRRWWEADLVAAALCASVLIVVEGALLARRRERAATAIIPVAERILWGCALNRISKGGSGCFEQVCCDVIYGDIYAYGDICGTGRLIFHWVGCGVEGD